MEKDKHRVVNPNTPGKVIDCNNLLHILSRKTPAQDYGKKNQEIINNSKETFGEHNGKQYQGKRYIKDKKKCNFGLMLQ